jgi:hypothetical protein
LTTKFTQHTAASPGAFSYQPSAIRKTTTHRTNFIAPPCSSHAQTCSLAAPTAKSLASFGLTIWVRRSAD